LVARRKGKLTKGFRTEISLLTKRFLAAEAFLAETSNMLTIGQISHEISWWWMVVFLGKTRVLIVLDINNSPSTFDIEFGQRIVNVLLLSSSSILAFGRLSASSLPLYVFR